MRVWDAARGGFVLCVMIRMSKDRRLSHVLDVECRPRTLPAAAALASAVAASAAASAAATHSPRGWEPHSRSVVISPGVIV